MLNTHIKSTESYMHTQKLLLALLFIIGVLFYSCDTSEPNNNKPNPPGYQEDVPWPSLADSPWPMFQRDPQNSGRSNCSGPSTGKIKWGKKLTFGVAPFFFSINNKQEILLTYNSVKPDSNLLTSDYLLSVSDSGELLWYHNLCKPNSFNQDETSSAISTIDGVTYVASSCGILFALNSDNEILWEFDTGEPIYNGIGGLNIDKSGNVYFSTISKFYSIDKDANVRWTKEEYKRQKAVFSSDGNMIYIKTEGSVDALDMNGTLIWSYPVISGEYLLFLISDSQSNIYFANSKSFFSITPQGKLRWVFNLETSDDFNYSVSPTIDKNGNIYFSTSEYLYSLDFEGTLRWKLEGVGINGGAHLINDINGNIYVANSRGGNLYSISNNGDINWTLNLGVNSYIYGGMAICENSTLYILTENAQLTSSYIYSIY